MDGRWLLPLWGLDKMQYAVCLTPIPVLVVLISCSERSEFSSQWQHCVHLSHRETTTVPQTGSSLGDDQAFK